ncbi:unnamed protein product [Peniophora sp. CBMAI 1063]|nr:unnamed protein product [Peniophora sp. CBMAI 1063]
MARLEQQDVDHLTTSTPVDAHPDESRATKNTRKRKATTEGERTARKKRKGRLSVLPTLPLDILYEIFAHLSPGDLLHLARTTKSFRNILMTRKAAFIWREVLDASVENGDPPRPADVSEPQWAALVYGRPWCTACGARTSGSTNWTLRVRLCTSCVTEQFRVVSMWMYTVPHKDPDTRLHEVLPADCVNYPSYTRKSTRPELVVTVKDLESYKDALASLREQYPDNAVFEAQRKILDDAMKSALLKRIEHASQCGHIDSTKAESRGNELNDIRKNRHTEIKARLLALGYLDVDVGHGDLGRHKDVWVPRPLTERVWEKIEPSVRQCVEGIHRRRIHEEVCQRRRGRESLVGQAYLDFLRTIADGTQSFMPSLANLVKLPLVSNVIGEDLDPSDDMLASIEPALQSSRPEIIKWMQRRAQQLRELVPDDWPHVAPYIAESDIEFSTFQPEEAFKDLDLVAYTWHYPLGLGTSISTHVIYGLDAIAQQNEKKHDVLSVKPAKRAHLVMRQILSLLGLDPAQTTVPQMHQLADSELFICEGCVGAGVFLDRDKINTYTPKPAGHLDDINSVLAYKSRARHPASI